MRISASYHYPKKYSVMEIKNNGHPVKRNSPLACVRSFTSGPVPGHCVGGWSNLVKACSRCNDQDDALGVLEDVSELLLLSDVTRKLASNAVRVHV